MEWHEHAQLQLNELWIRKVTNTLHNSPRSDGATISISAAIAFTSCLTASISRSMTTVAFTLRLHMLFRTFTGSLPWTCIPLFSTALLYALTHFPYFPHFSYFSYFTASGLWSRRRWRRRQRRRWWSTHSVCYNFVCPLDSIAKMALIDIKLKYLRT